MLLSASVTSSVMFGVRLKTAGNLFIDSGLWVTGEQPSPEVSKNPEPSEIRGTFCYDLLCEQIKKFKGKIPLGETAE